MCDCVFVIRDTLPTVLSGMTLWTLDDDEDDEDDDANDEVFDR